MIEQLKTVEPKTMGEKNAKNLIVQPLIKTKNKLGLCAI